MHCEALFGRSGRNPIPAGDTLRLCDGVAAEISGVRRNRRARCTNSTMHARKAGHGLAVLQNWIVIWTRGRVTCVDESGGNDD